MKIRIFLDVEFLKIGQEYYLNKAQTHYLRNVLRQKDGAKVFIFNNKDGEFLVQILHDLKKVKIKVIQQTKTYYIGANICLAYAPVKNVKSEYIITKATELGIREIQPIQTERTIIKKVNLIKLELNAIEAAEQSRRVDLPSINDLISLSSFIKSLQNEIVIFADESGDGEPPNILFQNRSFDKNNKIYVIIGPEGGFSSVERELIKSYKNSYSIILGPRILRSDTAIISCLALLQNYIGDIASKPCF